MAIKLDIALEQLAAPGIAEALARLVGALADPIASTAPVAKPRAATPAKAAPTILAEVPDAAERYRRFVAGLPERSRRFIEMVRTHELLKISDAMRALGLTAPKAMGGLTGSIGRWAPNRGVKVPYETTTSDGERAWRWIGSPVDEATVPAAPERVSDTPTMLPAARPPVTTAPPPALPAVKAAAKTKPKAATPAPKAEPKATATPAPKATATPAPKATATPAPKATAKPASKAKPKAAAKSVAPTPVVARKAPDFRNFEALPEKSQQFLTLVASRGLVTREEALEALGLRRPKELGGVTEPIVRRCREQEIDRPYVAGKRDGKRVWIWATHPVPTDVEVT